MKNSMARDAIRLTVARVITTAIGLLTMILLSHFRTLEEYGSFSQVQTVVNIFVSLFILGLPGSLSYFLVRNDGDRDRRVFLSNYLTLSTLISLVLGAALFFSTPLIESYYGNDYLGALAFAFALLPWASITFGGFDNFMVVYKRTHLLMIFKISYSTCLLLAILIAEWQQLSFHDYMILYLLVQSAFSAVIYILVTRIAGHLRVSADRRLLQSVLAFSIPLGLATVVGTWNIELDKLIVGRLTNTESLAIYSNGSRELPVSLLTTAMTAVLLPRVVRDAKEFKFNEATDMWGTATIISYYVICFFSALCIVASPQVMTVLYSEKYLPGVPVFRVYSLVMLMRTTYFGMILNAVGKTKMILLSSLIALTMNVTLSVPLFWVFGLIGPAIASLVSIVSVGLLQLYLTGRITGITFRALLPWRSLFRVSLVNVVMGVIVYSVLWSIHAGTDMAGIARTVGVCSLWVIVYALVMRKSFQAHWARIDRIE